MTNEIQKINYPEFSNKKGETARLQNNFLPLLAKIEVELNAVVGHTRLSIEQLNDLQLEEILCLDTLTNAPILLQLNGKTIASGELIVVNEHFGIKLTTIHEDRK